MRVMIQAGLIATSLGDCFRAFHHERLAHWTDIAGRFRFDGVLALRIIGAGVEHAEPSTTLGHLAGSASRTFDTGGRLIRIF